MTKVSVFGQETEKKKGKPIEFVGILKTYPPYFEDKFNGEPKDWDNVQLYCKNTNGYDIILAWDDDNPKINSVFLGHWNDGFVE